MTLASPGRVFKPRFEPIDFVGHGVLTAKVNQAVGSFHEFHMPVEEGDVAHFRAMNG